MFSGLSLVHQQIESQALSAPYQVSFRPRALERDVVQHFRNWLLAESQRTTQMLEEKIKS